MTKPTTSGTLHLRPKPAKPAKPAPAAPASKPTRPSKPAPQTAGVKPTRPQRSAPDTRPSRANAAPKPAPEPTGDRLAKRLAAQVPCSRADAERYIEGGWVQVDGQVVEEPQHRVLAQQAVTIDPNATLIELPPLTLILHKPADWVDGTEESLARLNRAARRSGGVSDARSLLDASHHLAKDPAGMRVLRRHFKNLEAMVPLETAASGLIVFTQDWRVARKLDEDMDTLEHELMVDVEGAVPDEALDKLTRLLARDHSLPHTRVSLGSRTAERSTLRFAIKGAHRGLVAHLCEQAGLTIVDMRRIRLGRVALRDLPVGQWRYLGGHERF
jgi:23S rRNA pseudouridine2604 synthase